MSRSSITSAKLNRARLARCSPCLDGVRVFVSAQFREAPITVVTTRRRMQSWQIFSTCVFQEFVLGCTDITEVRTKNQSDDAVANHRQNSACARAPSCFGSCYTSKQYGSKHPQARDPQKCASRWICQPSFASDEHLWSRSATLIEPTRSSEIFARLKIVSRSTLGKDHACWNNYLCEAPS